MTERPRTAEVHVIQLPTGKFKVRPGVVIVKQGQTFQLFNDTNADIAWVVWKSELFGSAILESIGAQAANQPMPVSGGRGTKYRYKVVINGDVDGNDGEEATGNSDPMIIIDPNP